jgi:hypothetical protein
MINRYNYEEYFLLLVDNELPAAEKKAVEEFVQQNPDLEQELNLLKQSVIKPESNIVFDNKNSLLKQTKEDSLINLNNYEEYLLSYIDDELDAITRDQVDEFLSRNSSLQSEFNLFQQTRLEPDDSIVFEGKESLYKKEDRRRPFLRAWIASAAAVAILLVTGFLFLNRNDFGRKNPDQYFARNDGDEKSRTSENKKEIPPVTSAGPGTLNDREEVQKNVTVKKQEPGKLSSNTVIAGKKKMKEVNLNQQKDLAAIPQEDISISENEAAVARFSQPEIEKSTAASSIEIAPRNLVVFIDNPVDDIKNSNDPGPNGEIAATENETDPEKKTKLRGIFRRVSRVFNKPANEDDNNKRSIAIGSFQIALR